MSEGTTVATAPSPVPASSPSSPGTVSPGPTVESSGSPSSAPPPAGKDTEGGTSTPAAPTPRKYKLKVNGQEQELEADKIDPVAEMLGMSPELLLKGTQLHKAGYLAFEEAKKTKAEAEALKARIKADPAGVLKELAGVDPDMWATQRVLEQLKAEEMTPEQRKLADLEAKYAQEQAARQKLEKERADGEAKTKREAELAQHRTKWNAEIPEIMKRLDVPTELRNPFLRKMADVMEAQVRAKAQVDTETAALLAHDHMLNESKWAVRQIKDPARLIKFIGEDAYKALLKHSVELARGAPPPSPIPVAPPAEPEAKPVYLSPEEWRKRFRG